ncbi:unnamed protein product [Caenorhabditis sp. 36 PRJEB53466]|nr:unnamed protein product [Caenorhabditis sp. 36 PRJEB53466]
MDSIMSGLYTFVTDTVVPTVTEGASNLAVLAEGAANVMNHALEWSSGSEDATASADVFSWEERPTVTEQKAAEPVVVSSEPGPAPAGSVDWEMVKEDPEETGPVKHNEFEMVEKDYEWMKNSK